MERLMDEDAGHCCLVAIGRLQVTSTPNTSDLAGSNSNAGNIIINNIDYFTDILHAIRVI